jgi:hypothetical protein
MIPENLPLSGFLQKVAAGTEDKPGARSPELKR